MANLSIFQLCSGIMLVASAIGQRQDARPEFGAGKVLTFADLEGQLESVLFQSFPRESEMTARKQRPCGRVAECPTGFRRASWIAVRQNNKACSFSYSSRILGSKFLRLIVPAKSRLIDQVMRDIESQTCIKFVNARNEDSFINIQPDIAA